MSMASYKTLKHIIAPLSILTDFPHNYRIVMHDMVILEILHLFSNIYIYIYIYIYIDIGIDI